MNEGWLRAQRGNRVSDQCPLCGFRRGFHSVYLNVGPPYRYCPDCGAFIGAFYADLPALYLETENNDL